MQRVVVLGPGGAGKSTLAIALADRTGLPVTHLDVLFYRADWSAAPVADAVAAVAAVVAADRWIIDGNFIDHARADRRFERAELVVLLDLPTTLCMSRVLSRLVRDHRRPRADLPAGARETFDPRGLVWIATYRRRESPRVLALLGGLGDGVDVRRLRSVRDVDAFLGGL